MKALVRLRRWVVSFEPTLVAHELVFDLKGSNWATMDYNTLVIIPNEKSLWKNMLIEQISVFCHIVPSSRDDYAVRAQWFSSVIHIAIDTKIYKVRGHYTWTSDPVHMGSRHVRKILSFCITLSKLFHCRLSLFSSGCPFHVNGVKPCSYITWRICSSRLVSF